MLKIIYMYCDEKMEAKPRDQILFDNLESKINGHTEEIKDLQDSLKHKFEQLKKKL